MPKSLPTAQEILRHLSEAYNEQQRRREAAVADDGQVAGQRNPPKLADAILRRLQGMADVAVGAYAYDPTDPSTMPVMGGTVLGRKAANAPHSALDEAERMADRADLGALPTGSRLWRFANDVIHHDTGAYVGVDGKVRWELADPPLTMPRWYGSGVRPREAERLGDVYDHPKLYEAYPDAKDIRLHFSDMPNPNLGEFDDGLFRESPVIKLYMPTIDRLSESPSEVLAHELQHYVQSKEGFQRGGSAQLFNGRELEYQRRALSNVESRLKEAKEAYNIALDKGEPLEGIKEYHWNLRDRHDDLRKMGQRELAFDAYRHLQGEAEARAVADRMRTPTQMTPYDSYDVSIKDLIDEFFYNRR